MLSSLEAKAGSRVSSRSPEQQQKLLAKGYARFVNPFQGTGGHGHTYPGATVPFGMVQLSPDTFDNGWDWCSGYHYSDSSIMGFSHTHLSGTGIGDMMDILLAPRIGPVKWTPGTRENTAEGYRSRFSHENEVAEPGYYSVILDDSHIVAELTATTRAGMHRYTFPAGDSHFLLDFSHVYGGPERVEEASLSVVGHDTILGSRKINGWANGRVIYFAMKVSRPFQRIEFQIDNTARIDETQNLKGKSIKCALHYRTGANDVILVKTGISAVSAENAMKNLDSEIPGWDFDGMRVKALKLWETELAKIQVEGGSEEHKRIFYTCLYHAMVAPTIFSDVDGRYRGMDDQIHQLPEDRHNYSTFSLWDTYRAAHPLYTLFQPKRVPDMVNSLIRMGSESPVGMPVWPLQGKETKCMTGYHSSVVIAEALKKKFPGIDPKAAYAVLRRQAMASDYRGLDLYRNCGYVPCDLSKDSVGESMDYAYNDWAVAQVAQFAGASEDAEFLLRRCQNYRVLYDREVGFIRPPLENGSWSTPFAPNEMGYSTKWRDYTESNPWTATFAVQHDIRGLARMLGGPEKLEEKLDGIFHASSEMPKNAPLDIAGLVGQYAHGNEPGHHIAYLYLYTGHPAKTQERVSSLLKTMYHDAPDGLAGNEDCGQMSAWFVMSAMGIYTVDPVMATYVFGYPLFDSVVIDLGEEKTLTIRAPKKSPDENYIHSISWNGEARSRLWFRHDEIQSGGTFELSMSSISSSLLGTNEADFPPSGVAQLV